jgi:hypothetical protein
LCFEKCYDFFLSLIAVFKKPPHNRRHSPIDTNLQNNFLLNLETQKQILFPSDIKLIFSASFEVSTALYQDSALWDVKCDAGRVVLDI